MVEGEGHDALVAEYGKAIEERKANGEREDRCSSSIRRIRTATAHRNAAGIAAGKRADRRRGKDLHPPRADRPDATPRKATPASMAAMR